MNCIELFVEQVKARPKSMAVFIPGKETTQFDELLEAAKRAQSLYLSCGIKPGMSVLLLDSLGTRLYGSITALLSMGATVILVEPWMPVAKIQQAIQVAKPHAFVSNTVGFLWGARVKAIREIPHWIRASSIGSASSQGQLHIEQIDSNTPGIITFTSGTTGNPKGVVRSQGYMIKQQQVLSKHLGAEKLQGPDLCIFANFVLSNLADGRGSIVVPPSWKPRILKSLDLLPKALQPESLTAGPAFLLQLMKNAQLQSLKSIHVGGALTDCWIFEEGFRHWPNAHWGHVYGGSEVEPVAVIDAHLAVAESKKRGLFQTLYLGKNVAEISPKIEPEGLWVAGPHVCPEYLGNDGENQFFKKKDSNGVLWHFMGDRILEDSVGWWYSGRSSQSKDDFALEQKIYQKLQSSRSFVHIQSTSSSTDSNGKQKWLVGQGLSSCKEELLREFPELHDVVETRIYRDRRHRARLDRKKTLEKGAQWLTG